jgi:hypothetical protein
MAALAALAFLLLLTPWLALRRTERLAADQSPAA